MAGGDSRIVVDMDGYLPRRGKHSSGIDIEDEDPMVITGDVHTQLCATDDVRQITTETQEQSISTRSKTPMRSKSKRKCVDNSTTNHEQNARLVAPLLQDVGSSSNASVANTIDALKGRRRCENDANSRRETVIRKKRNAPKKDHTSRL